MSSNLNFSNPQILGEFSAVVVGLSIIHKSIGPLYNLILFSKHTLPIKMSKKNTEDFDEDDNEEEEEDDEEQDDDGKNWTLLFLQFTHALWLFEDEGSGDEDDDDLETAGKNSKFCRNMTLNCWLYLPSLS